MRKIGASLLALGLLAVAGGGADKKPVPRFTIGKETTYVTGPLDDEGYVDYVAALNERLGKGIKPEENANVLLWTALGPRPAGAKMPPEFFKYMGIEAPPERGEYFIPLWRYVDDRLKVKPGERANEIQAQQELATKRPWRAKEYPALAAALKANEKPLALVIEATRRPQYFSPLLPARGKKKSAGLVEVRQQGVQECRELAIALTTRAMLRVGEGRLDDAWQDLLACHRLGRLVGRGGTVIEALVGIALDTVAGAAGVAFLDAGKLTAKQLRNCLRDLEQLSPLPEIADKVDLGERFTLLECLTRIERRSFEALDTLPGAEDEERDPQAERFLLDNIDWDAVLRNLNRWADRVAAALRVKDRHERKKTLARLGRELEELDKTIATEVRAARKEPRAKKSAKAFGKSIGDTFICLTFSSLLHLQKSVERTEQRHANLRVAFALAAYRSEHGRYPAKLNELAPKYLAKVPGDLFSGKALVYRPSEKGYLLYSVGVNGKDDEGRGDDDDPPGDDLAVRMPLPKPSRR